MAEAAHFDKDGPSGSTAWVTFESLRYDRSGRVEYGVVERYLREVWRREQDLASCRQRVHPSQVKGRVTSHGTW